MSSRKVMAIQARKKRKAKPKKNQTRRSAKDASKPTKKSDTDKNDDGSPPTAALSTIDDHDTDSAPELDEEEILGSDDDEQESPKDYCKVSAKILCLPDSHSFLGGISPGKSRRFIQFPVSYNSKAWVGSFFDSVVMLGYDHQTICRT